METKEKKSIWDLYENPPTYAQGVADLAEWSLNFDYGQRPYLLFLDLIGYNSEEYGETFTNLDTLNLGYVEISKLSTALEEYACDPHRVTDFIKELENAEDK